MPVVTFDHDDLVSLIGREVSVDTLLDRVPQLGADVHSYDQESGKLSIEFFPDRPDLYSVEGAARALRAFLGFHTGLASYQVEASDIVLNLDESVRTVRPFMVAGVIEDITITDRVIRSMMELQEKLHLTMGRKRAKVSIGIHDMDRVTPLPWSLVQSLSSPWGRPRTWTSRKYWRNTKRGSTTRTSWRAKTAILC
jgi:phenylalanyl-tRNA synthetase beta chain